MRLFTSPLEPQPVLLASLHAAPFCSQSPKNPSWLEGLCHCRSSRTEDSMDGGFDENTIYSKMTLIPATYSQINVIGAASLILICLKFLVFVCCAIDQTDECYTLHLMYMHLRNVVDLMTTQV